MQAREKILLAVFLILAIFGIHHIKCEDTPEPCKPENDVCEFWLTIEERLVLHQDNVRVVAINGSLYKHDQGPETDEAKRYNVSLNQVITMDGYERAVITANNSIPGPPLVVYKDQTIIVHVHNHLLSESVTIHWHGIHQKGTPFSDGVAFISQCPILPGQTFAYEFKASPSGTFFYHSHVGGQRVDGLFGALIIKEKPQANGEEEIEDYIMHVGDWFHSRSSELHAKMLYGNYKTKKGFKHPQTIDGVQFAPYGWKSAYIEGKGQYYDPETGLWSQTPNHVYNVTSNKKYRFRVIGSGLIVPLRISVDGHMLSIVATDGYEVEPVPVESLIINPGERYDFILTANQTVGNYWVRCDSTEDDVINHYARAILRYDGAPLNEDPTSSRIACTSQKKCIVLNCMFPSYPNHHNTDCLLVHDLRAAHHEEDIEELPVFTKGQSREIMLNWVAGDGRMVVNGNIFEHPAVSSATQHEDIRHKIKCNETSCVGLQNCYCYHEIDLPKDETIQMVWTNHGDKERAKRHHPIHLHGHSFHVLKVGFGEYNSSSKLYKSPNKDIHCATEYCNQPVWSNQSFGGDDIPEMRFDRPIQKDTLMVPVGAYAVIRFKTNNPGKWFLHCHIEYHSMQGMAMVINEAPGHHPPRPKGFPICQNYYSDDEQNLIYEKQEATEADEEEDTKKIYFILFIVFLVLTCIEFLIIIVQCCGRAKRKTSASVVEMKQSHVVS
ncbi:uncharacterized protein [Clytia hemisphaerica]|uniref:Uncharacterized protein n=1 Tax=Clytia hemisphaerica TaxID=252671 RepID=A0A7M5WTF0_9CNID